MSHTPGPWEVDSEGGMLPCVVAGDKLIYQSARGLGIEDNATIEANARLIAAAPDLLEALRATLAQWTMAGYGECADETCGCIQGQARRAIAKAEGGISAADEAKR